jgi:UPF0755 protein
MTRGRVLLAGLLVALVGLSGLAYGGYRYYDGQIHARHRVGQGPIDITVPPNTSVTGVADILSRKGVIVSRLAFQVYVRLNGYNSKLDAGHYQVPAGADTIEVVALMGHARGNEVSVTIPEGFTAKQAGDVFQQSGLFSAQKYVAAVEHDQFNQDFLASRPQGSSVDGFLFPDTFFFSPKASPDDVINAQLNRFGEVVTPEMRAHAADHNLTLYQEIVLASIVEREAKFDQDRGQIAAVFYNRLAIGMPLEADATLLFAKGATGGPVTEPDKSINSPYNTYANKGLPPGPICNPGLASIKAALTPAQNGFLFYVTDRDGHAHFSRTLAEHQQQIAQYGAQ